MFWDALKLLTELKLNKSISQMTCVAMCGRPAIPNAFRVRRIQSETPAIALPNEWHALGTFALFSEQFLPLLH